MHARIQLRKLRENQGGFTLIELLVVIGILAILLAITLIAINPNKHFQDTRDAQRSSDVAAILDSIYEYESSNSGSQPPSVADVTSTPTAIGGVNMSAGNTTFSTPNLVFTGLTANPITSGEVTVENCTTPGNNGTHTVVSGTATTLTVSNTSGAAGDSTCDITGWDGRINLCADVVPTYLAALPVDPASTATACTGNFDTGYTISSANGRFTVAAPNHEGSNTISVTR